VLLYCEAMEIFAEELDPPAEGLAAMIEAARESARRFLLPQ